MAIGRTTKPINENRIINMNESVRECKLFTYLCHEFVVGLECETMREKKNIESFYEKRVFFLHPTKGWYGIDCIMTQKKKNWMANRIWEIRVMGLGRIDFVNEEIEHFYRTDEATVRVRMFKPILPFLTVSVRAEIGEFLFFNIMSLLRVFANVLWCHKGARVFNFFSRYGLC